MAKYKCYYCKKEKEQQEEPFILRGLNILLCFSCFMKFAEMADKNPVEVIQDYKKELKKNGIEKMELKSDGFYINERKVKIDSEMCSMQRRN